MFRPSAKNDDAIPCILEPELTDKAFRHNWERLIQKKYEVNSLVCPKCSAPMRVIAFIEQADVIRKILEPLRLWGKPVQTGPADQRAAGILCRR